MFNLCSIHSYMTRVDFFSILKWTNVFVSCFSWVSVLLYNRDIILHHEYFLSYIQPKRTSK